MKLKEVLSGTMSETKDTTQKGTYAGYRLSQDDDDTVINLIKEIGVPNPINRSDLHLTLLYSRKFLKDYTPSDYTDIWAYPNKFHVFNGQDGKNILVLMLDCSDCVKRHKELMKQHKVTYNFPEYLPHLTLSYDIGDWFDADAEKINKEFGDKLPTKFHIADEYQESLKLDWKSNN